MAGRHAVVPTLELISNTLPTRMIEIEEDELRVGRDPSSDVALALKQVSWSHARIRRRLDGGYLIEDLESYNGTYLEGRKLPPRVPTPLKDGSRIRICDVTLVFRLQAVEVSQGAATILGTLDDVSSLSLASRPERAGTLLRAVLEINKLLGGTSELNEVLGLALGELFLIFAQADCGFILTREPDGKLRPRATRQRVDNGPPPTLSRTVLDHVVLEGKAILISDVHEDSRFGSEGSLSGTGIRTAMCVPISSREGVPIGIIQLDSRRQGVMFTQNDLELLAAVSVPIGVVVENYRLLKEKASLIAAAEVQAALLPRRRPEMPGYTFWERYQPALEVGGDYYDYVPVESSDRGPLGRWSVVLGDVAGKGMSAALVMANLSAEVRHLVRSGSPAHETTSRANRHIHDADLPGRFVTFVIAEVDPVTHELRLANAGHMPPLVRRASGVIETLGCEEESGLPLGIDRDCGYGPITGRLERGDVVVMFTDGVTEAMNRQDQTFGTENLRKAIAASGKGPSQVGDGILRSLRAHVGNRPQFDDIALICFGRE
ncbi:MAG: SpoIIE family protein phosphatase [Isosphaeraceae bacterium]